jgi:rod shape-determining protein MreC
LRKLLDILTAFKEYSTLAICVLISIGLLSVNDTRQIREIRSATIMVVGAVQEKIGFIPNYFSLRKENTILRERNVNLAAEVSLLRESRLANIRLRKLLELKERSQFRYVAANIIGKNHQPLRTTVTLDVGEEDGVRYNMPIVTDAGLAGRIVATGSHYSIGQLMQHKDFRASVMIERDRVDCILHWGGGELFQLKNVPRTADVKVGDAVVTSGFSTIFPPGIKVGVVALAALKQNAMFQSVEVAPAADFSRLEEVFVVLHTADSSRITLEKRVK